MIFSTSKKLIALKKENSQLRKEVNKIAGDFRRFEKYITDSMNKMSVIVVDENQEPIDSSRFAASSRPLRRDVPISAVIHELAEYVDVTLSFRQSDDGYLQVVGK